MSPDPNGTAALFDDGWRGPVGRTREGVSWKYAPEFGARDFGKAKREIRLVRETRLA